MEVEIIYLLVILCSLISLAIAMEITGINDYILKRITKH